MKILIVYEVKNYFFKRLKIAAFPELKKIINKFI